MENRRLHNSTFSLYFVVSIYFSSVLSSMFFPYFLLLCLIVGYFFLILVPSTCFPSVSLLVFIIFSTFFAASSFFSFVLCLGENAFGSLPFFLLIYFFLCVWLHVSENQSGAGATFLHFFISFSFCLVFQGRWWSVFTSSHTNNSWHIRKNV